MGYEKRVIYGIGGIDHSKPNNNILQIIDTRTIENTTEHKKMELNFCVKNYLEDNIGTVRLNMISLGLTPTAEESLLIQAADAHYLAKLEEIATKNTVDDIDLVAWELV